MNKNTKSSMCKKINADIRNVEITYSYELNKGKSITPKVHRYYELGTRREIETFAVCPKCAEKAKMYRIIINLIVCAFLIFLIVKQ